jgi:hypothetical protein
MIIMCASAQSFIYFADSVNSLGMTELSDANSFSEINSRMLPLSEFSTPKKRQCFSQDVSVLLIVCFFAQFKSTLYSGQWLLSVYVWHEHMRSHNYIFSN